MGKGRAARHGIPWSGVIYRGSLRLGGFVGVRRGIVRHKAGGRGSL